VSERSSCATCLPGRRPRRGTARNADRPERRPPGPQTARKLRVLARAPAQPRLLTVKIALGPTAPGTARQAPGPSVEVVSPVRRHPALRPWHRLVERMVSRWRQRWAVHELLSAVVVVPVLTGLEAADDWVVLRTRVAGGMLARRVVTAPDMPTLCAAAKVQPPSPRLQAFDAPGAARGHSWDDKRIAHRYHLQAKVAPRVRHDHVCGARSRRRGPPPGSRDEPP
jgi:hypothetical protein